MTSKKYTDVIISMDADLQDDINVIDKILDKYYNGCEIVYGVREKRDTDTFLKRFTAETFYKAISFMAKDTTKIIFNHADCRLMSKRALEEFLKFDEVNLFHRGLVSLVGFKSDVVTYERE